MTRLAFRRSSASKARSLWGPSSSSTPPRSAASGPSSLKRIASPRAQFRARIARGALKPPLRSPVWPSLSPARDARPTTTARRSACSSHQARRSWRARVRSAATVAGGAGASGRAATRPCRSWQPWMWAARPPAWWWLTETSGSRSPSTASSASTRRRTPSSPGSTAGWWGRSPQVTAPVWGIDVFRDVLLQHRSGHEPHHPIEIPLSVRCRRASRPASARSGSPITLDGTVTRVLTRSPAEAIATIPLRTGPGIWPGGIVAGSARDLARLRGRQRRQPNRSDEVPRRRAVPAARRPLSCRHGRHHLGRPGEE